jgi:hypothetical protein
VVESSYEESLGTGRMFAEMDFSWCKHSQLVWFSPGMKEGLMGGILRRQRAMSELMGFRSPMGIQCVLAAFPPCHRNKYNLQSQLAHCRPGESEV